MKMKLIRVAKFDFKKMNREISAEAQDVLSRKGARLSLSAAFVFIVATLGAGIIMSYLLLNILDYFSVKITNPIALIITVSFAILFATPAIAGMRRTAAALCDGREASVAEIFIAFSSAGRLFSAYLEMLCYIIRYSAILLILFMPDVLQKIFGEELPPYALPIAGVICIVIFFCWYILTAKIARLSHFLWGKNMTFFAALRESFKGILISRGFTLQRFIDVLLSAATCLIYFIFAAGPKFAIQKELVIRNQSKYINELEFEKSRKDGQDK